MSEICPTGSAKAAFSKDGCIWPFPNIPKSPPFRALLQSDSTLAIAAKSLPPSTICFRMSLSLVKASSLLRVIVASRQLEGFLDPVCYDIPMIPDEAIY